MSDERAPLRIRYEYKEEPETKLRYAHGVLGGINSQGEIEMNFYMESDTLPAFSERIVSENGELGHEVLPFDDNVKHISRKIHSKVVLSYHSARGLLDWLEEQLAALDNDEEFSSYFSDNGGGGIQH